MAGLFVRANPASARIAVDGVPVQGNPYHGQYPRNEVHVLEVTARGYDSKSEQVFLANDVFIAVSLDWHVVTSRRTAPPPGAGAPRRRSRGSRSPRPGVTRSFIPSSRAILTELRSDGKRSTRSSRSR